MGIRFKLGTLCTAALLFGCSDSNPPNNGTPDGGDSGVNPEGGSEGGLTKPSGEILILSLSDWHGQLDTVSSNDANGESQTYGGLPVLASYVKQERATNPNNYFLLGGDEFGATPPLSNFNNDTPAVKGLNYLKVDADTFGNHNFDHGMQFIKDRLDESQHPFVTSNLTNVPTELGSKPILDFYILPEHGTSGIKVGVIGITNPDAPQLLFPGQMKTIVIQEPISAANKAAKHAREAGAHVVVALTHMGAVSKDAAGLPSGPLIDYAKGLQGIDVVLGDHTDFQVNTKIGDVLVLENNSKGRTYGRIKVTVASGVVTAATGEIVNPAATVTAHLNDQTNAVKCGNLADPTTTPPTPAQPGCKCIGSTAPQTDVACPATFTCNGDPKSGKCTKPAIAPDPDAAALLAPYQAALSAAKDIKIGTIDVEFKRDQTQSERLMEVPIGDFVTDALLDYYKPTGVQIAFTNGGGLRDALPSSYAPSDKTLRRTTPGYAAGPPYDLVVGDIFSVLPFGNQCITRGISGQLLWQVLEKSVFSEPGRYGGFLQISGFKYTYKLSGAPGARVQSVTLLDGSNGGAGKDIPSTDTTVYQLVTNDFTNSGGDGYTILKEPTPSAPRDIMADVLQKYVVKTTPIPAYPTPLTRITQMP